MYFSIDYYLENGFFIDAINRVSEFYLKQLIDESYILHHITECLMKHLYDSIVSLRTIEMMAFGMFDNPSTSFFDNPSIKNELSKKSLAKLKKEIYKLSERDIISFYLKKPSITARQEDILLTYFMEMSKYADEFCFTQSVEKEVIDYYCDQLKFNSYVREHMLDNIIGRYKEKQHLQSKCFAYDDF